MGVGIYNTYIFTRKSGEHVEEAECLRVYYNYALSLCKFPSGAVFHVSSAARGDFFIHYNNIIIPIHKHDT